MDAAYHRAITLQALGGVFSARALKVILAANLSLDGLIGQLMHPEYHFDDNAFAAGEAFLQARRAEVRPYLEAGKPDDAWRAFGKLTHAVQDFYAHTNYVTLWLRQTARKPDQTPAEIDPLRSEILSSPELKSGRLYYPWELLAFIPLVGRWVIPLLPRDSHAWMNIDSPARPAYAWAESAAIQRTRYEFDQLIRDWPHDLVALFTDIQEV
jgi:hypothetical protein